MTDFIMHPRLAAGGHYLAKTHNCDVMLKNNAHYHWLIIVPRIESDKTEITDLSEQEYSNITACTLSVSKFIKETFSTE